MWARSLSIMCHIISSTLHDPWLLIATFLLNELIRWMSDILALLLSLFIPFKAHLKPSLHEFFLYWHDHCIFYYCSKLLRVHYWGIGLDTWTYPCEPFYFSRKIKLLTLKIRSRAFKITCKKKKKSFHCQVRKRNWKKIAFCSGTFSKFFLFELNVNLQYCWECKEITPLSTLNGVYECDNYGDHLYSFY